MARKILCWTLFAAGLFFLASGARDLFESHFAQSQAANEWRGEEQAAPPAKPVPESPIRIGESFGKLWIPRLDANFYVVEGTGNRELRRGPGHMPGTAMPGAPGNCIVAGHRDTHFRVLKDVRKGDEIVLETRGGEYLYRVTSLSVVSPKNNKPLADTTRPVLHLITCYPFYYVGPAPKRFIVQAELVSVDAAVQPPGTPARRPS